MTVRCSLAKMVPAPLKVGPCWLAVLKVVVPLVVQAPSELRPEVLVILVVEAEVEPGETVERSD